VNSKIFVASSVIVFLIILVSSTSVQRGIFAADPGGGKALFDCTYDTDKNKEICCDSSNDNLKCLECEVDLQTEQKYNCKEVPASTNDVQPADLVKAPQNLDKLPENLSESES